MANQWDVNQKSREQGGRYVAEFCERFLSTDQVNKKTYHYGVMN